MSKHDNKPTCNNVCQAFSTVIGIAGAIALGYAVEHHFRFFPQTGDSPQVISQTSAAAVTPVRAPVVQ